MKPIIQEETQDTILTKDITEQHIVVAVIGGDPCILTKGYWEPKEKLTFQSINDFEHRGNGYYFSTDENTEKKMVEYAMKSHGGKNKVAVFHQSDWKQALQWLIDNA